MPMGRQTQCLVTVLAFTAALWAVNILWLQRDTRPPVWDMALHQSYALNYVPQSREPAQAMSWASRSGNYPPFVHMTIALCFLIFHPSPHIAVLANIPATMLLFWAVYMLGWDLAGARAARWACLLTALTPYLLWMSRETVLDYWLAAWVAAGLVALRKTEGFESHSRSFLFGLTCALGMLTKWFFAAFLFLPLLYVGIRFRIWRDRARMLHLADALLVAGLGAGVWYLPNLPNLTRYFMENAQVGALEGEPRVFSFQSLIYYLRLLEGYQLFGILFLLLILAVVFTWRRRLLRDGKFLIAAVCGGWLAMTLLRTKDPRFTMPLLGPMFIVAGAWLQSWSNTRQVYVLKAGLALVLGFQAYAANFGVRWLPQEIVLAHGYSGSLRWDWNLYLQHYFHVLGAPRREDWKLEAILGKVAEDARTRNAPPDLALIPDLPRFNAMNFTLTARLRGWPVHVRHLRTQPDGVQAFDGFQYVVMTDGDQGMSWTTGFSRALSEIIVDDPRTFRLVELYILPDGSCARLYSIHRSSTEEDGPRRVDAEKDIVSSYRQSSIPCSSTRPACSALRLL
ncbi:MAG: glycosyltransferase family 39 protein [Acidobacteriia bacterium]|nr:glycosyltransferase family 39 protein [Terriglobia bacterium]